MYSERLRTPNYDAVFVSRDQIICNYAKFIVELNALEIDDVNKFRLFPVLGNTCQTIAKRELERNKKQFALAMCDDLNKPDHQIILLFQQARRTAIISSLLNQVHDEVSLVL